MFFRIEGWVQTPLGAAVAGASVAILDQPADFSTQPGSPLADIFAADTSNSANVTAALWEAQQIQFTLDAVPADVVPNSYIGISGASPSTFDSTLEAPYLVVSVVGLVVTVAALTNPGTWISGGVVATSLLPNPLTTDGNGYYFAYAAAGLFSLQVYYSTVELDYPDQQNGTVAGGSVTSVGLTVPGEFSVTGSPVTSFGTLVVAWETQTANFVLAGPTSGPAAAPTFRALVAGDLPGGVGTVSSVALTISPPGIFTSSVAGSPITASGTLAITLGLATQTANFVWAGPTSGAAAQPTFRALTLVDEGIRTNRTAYTPSSGDASNEQKNLTVTFATAFADTDYTVEASLTLGALSAWPGASVVVAMGAFILDPNGNIQQATTGGTTGTTIPTFAEGPTGTTTADNAGGGTVVWTLFTMSEIIYFSCIKEKTATNFVVELGVGDLLPVVVETIAIHD